MAKTLVAFYSASGITKQIAKQIAKSANADIFEIIPKIPYTEADLDGWDENSRSTREARNRASRPEIENKVGDMSQYDTLFIGFPIWWFLAPTIIRTFLESYDLSGKKIILFGTSGGSGMGKSMDDLKLSAPNSEFLGQKLLNPPVSQDVVDSWVKSFGI